jgi:hypothetical protein
MQYFILNNICIFFNLMTLSTKNFLSKRWKWKHNLKLNKYNLQFYRKSSYIFQSSNTTENLQIFFNFIISNVKLCIHFYFVSFVPNLLH